MNKAPIVTILIFHLLSCASAQDPYSLPNRLKFARHLYRSGSFELALKEISSMEELPSGISFCDSLHNLEAIIFRHLAESEPMKQLDIHHNILAGDRWQPFRELEIAAWYLLSGQASRFSEWEKTAGFIQADCRLAVEQMKMDWKKFSESKPKSPVAAGILATIFPGAGKAYLGNAANAVTTFLSTGLVAATAVEGFTKNQFRSGQFWVFAGAGIVLHSASVFGSIQHAKKFNIGISTDFHNALLAHVSFALHGMLDHEWPGPVRNIE